MLKHITIDGVSVMTCRSAAAYGDFEPGKQGKGIRAGTGKRPCLRRNDELGPRGIHNPSFSFKITVSLDFFCLLFCVKTKK